MVGMVAKGTSPVHLQRNQRGFINLLSHAACEWFLIFMLFVDAALLYLLTKFACYCELQIPCLLCSRLDHVFGNQKPGIYWSQLCSNHRVGISSLISCHIHSKLADARGMCEECLMSFDMQDESNTEAYKRLLMGKIGVEFERGGFQSPFSNKKPPIPGSLSTRTCSCCNKSWRARPNVQRLLQLTPIGFGAPKPNDKPPLPRLSGRSRFSRRDSLKRIRDKFSGPVTSRPLGNNGVDPLSHVGYTELKITSDSESEVPFSDDDDGSSVAREKVVPKEELVQHGSEIWPKTQTDDLAPVNQAQEVSNPASSLLDQCVLLDVSESLDEKCLPSDADLRNGLGELSWLQVSPNPKPSALPELILLNDVPPSPNDVEVPMGASVNKPEVPLSQQFSLLALSEIIPPDGFPPSSDVMEEAFGASPEKYVTGTSDIGHISVSKHAEFLELASKISGTGCKNDQFSNDTTSSMPNDMDSSDAYKLAVGNKGREVSGIHAHKLALSDPEKVTEEWNPLPHILSANRIDIPLNNTSSKAYDPHGELDRSDTSSLNGIRAHKKPVFLGDSGYESHDGSSVSEIEGESSVDRLKRQVNYDRRCMSALYKELDEERNASAVAVNQAMAMITRLQEEKAALHMEALQYLRMMEEQAEYDMEALEKANDLLAEREKEIQDLETELEFYRNNFSDESMVLHEETYGMKGGNMMVENSACVPCNSSISATISEGSKICIDVKTSLLEFEDEKIYISQCLKKLERKLRQVYSKEAPPDMPNGGCAEQVADGVHNQEEFVTQGGTREDHRKEENGLSMRKILSELNGSANAQEGSIASVDENHFVSKENNHFDSEQQKFSMHDGKNDLVALEKEISDLNDRLESLEADRNFLEHVFNSLQNGNEGLRFVQEIVHQLQELRKFGIKERCLSVH